MTDKELEIKNSDRPLITFALFAFNQEKYIREAIEGALSQTYEPLEIILSDDCSNDRTFEIMQEMAAAYRGAHRIVVRQSEINFGTALHVSAVGKRAKGRLIVVAAGDDISIPTRVERLTDAWINAGMPNSLVHSNIVSFSDDNPENKTYRKPIILNNYNIESYEKSKFQMFMPQSCAYSKELFDTFPPLFGGSLIEDGPMFFRAILMGTPVYVDEGLVIQRILNESAGTGYGIKNISKWNHFVMSRIIGAITEIRDFHIYERNYQNSLLTHKKLIEKRLSFIRNLSKCLFSPYWINNFFGKILISLTLIFFYRQNAPFYERIYFVVGFLDKKNSPFIERLRRIAKSCKRPR